MVSKFAKCIPAPLEVKLKQCSPWKGERKEISVQYIMIKYQVVNVEQNNLGSNASFSFICQVLSISSRIF